MTSEHPERGTDERMRWLFQELHETAEAKDGETPEESRQRIKRLLSARRELNEMVQAACNQLTSSEGLAWLAAHPDEYITLIETFEGATPLLEETIAQRGELVRREMFVDEA
jgi:hypothetical protein